MRQQQMARLVKSLPIPFQGPSHVQNANAFASWLRMWMRRFKGVAIKYFDSCLGWFRVLNRFTPIGPQPVAVLGLAVGQ